MSWTNAFAWNKKADIGAHVYIVENQMPLDGSDDADSSEPATNRRRPSIAAGDRRPSRNRTASTSSMNLNLAPASKPVLAFFQKLTPEKLVLKLAEDSYLGAAGVDLEIKHGEPRRRVIPVLSPPSFCGKVGTRFVVRKEGSACDGWQGTIRGHYRHASNSSSGGGGRGSSGGGGGAAAAAGDDDGNGGGAVAPSGTQIGHYLGDDALVCGHLDNYPLPTDAAEAEEHLALALEQPFMQLFIKNHPGGVYRNLYSLPSNTPACLFDVGSAEIEFLPDVGSFGSSSGGATPQYTPGQTIVTIALAPALEPAAATTAGAGSIREDEVQTCLKWTAALVVRSVGGVRYELQPLPAAAKGGAASAPLAPIEVDLNSTNHYVPIQHSGSADLVMTHRRDIDDSSTLIDVVKSYERELKQYLEEEHDRTGTVWDGITNMKLNVEHDLVKIEVKPMGLSKLQIMKEQSDTIRQQLSRSLSATSTMSARSISSVPSSDDLLFRRGSFTSPERSDSAASFSSARRGSVFTPSKMYNHSRRATSNFKDIDGLCETLMSTDSSTLEDRQHGLHSAMPVMIWAGAGTGKTWMMRHALYILSKPDLDQAGADAPSSGYFCNFSPEAKPLELRNPIPASERYVPLLIPLHKLFASWKRYKQRGKPRSDDFVERFINDSDHCSPERKAMLLDAYRSMRLIMLFDGLDEAPDLLRVFKFDDFLVDTLLKGQHRFVLTSRPEGIFGRIRTLRNDPRLANVELEPFSGEQQGHVLPKQLKGQSQEFVKHLLDYTEYPKRSDSTFNGLNKGRDKEYFTKLLKSKGIDEQIGRQQNVLCQEEPTGSKRFAGTIDELIVAAEAATPIFEAVLDGIATKGQHQYSVHRGDPKTIKEEILDPRFPSQRVLLLPSRKAEERIAQKANDKYADRTEAPKFAWVLDVLRASFLCATAEDICYIETELNGMDNVTVVRRKNLFADLDQTKFRRISLTLQLDVPAVGDGSGAGQTFVHFAELQIHIFAIFEVCDGSHSTYEYFRNLLKKSTSKETSLQMAQLDTYLSTWGSFLRTPVLMAMLAVVLQQVYQQNASAEPSFDNMPKSPAELYERATRTIVARTLNVDLQPPKLKYLKAYVTNVQKEDTLKHRAIKLTSKGSFAKEVWPYMHARRIMLDGGGWTIKPPGVAEHCYTIELPHTKSPDAGATAFRQMMDVSYDDAAGGRSAKAGVMEADVESMVRVLELVSFETMFGQSGGDEEDGEEKGARRVFTFADIHRAIYDSCCTAVDPTSEMDAVHLIWELCLRTQHGVRADGEVDDGNTKYAVPTLKILSHKAPSPGCIFPLPADVSAGRFVTQKPPDGGPEVTFRSVHTSIQEYLCVKRLGSVLRTMREQGARDEEIHAWIANHVVRKDAGRKQRIASRWASDFINDPNHKNCLALATEDFLNELLLDADDAVARRGGGGGSAGGGGGGGRAGGSGGSTAGGGGASTGAAKPKSTGKSLDLNDTGGINFAECLKGNARWGQGDGVDECTLDLTDNNRLHEKGKIAIFEALQVNSVLSKLVMQDITISEKSGIALANALKTNRTLWFLDLNGSRIEKKAAKMIGNMLEHNRDTQLRVLMFANSTFHSQGAGALADAIRNNDEFLTNKKGVRKANVGRLNLRGKNRDCVNVGPEGGLRILQALAERAGGMNRRKGIVTGMHLVRLNLACNGLNSRCGGPLGELLKYSTSLKFVCLKNNKLKCAGVESLARGLKVNRSLEVLDLESNQIRREGGKAVLLALLPDGGGDVGDGDDQGGDPGPHTLKRLNLDHNSFDARSDPMWAGVTKANPGMRLGPVDKK